ncbi:hypothetical protein K9L16_03285 [Candidatus Pacearchaeota archaeon]|nr:hypothetical protein [Candidatus Pacearchaeota archaeon]
MQGKKFVAWALPETQGPGYKEVVKQFPEKYELRNGDVWSKNPFYKIAEYKFPGRPITKKSLKINHDFCNLEKLTATLKLARILEEQGCSDFIEIPSKQNLEIVSKKRL